MKLLIAFLFILITPFTTLAQPDFKIIRHDSVSLTMVDTFLTFNGEKIAINKRNQIYAAALSPIYPLKRVMKSPAVIKKELPFNEQTGKYDYTALKCFATTKGMIVHCITYVALINNEKVVINSPEKFREIYAPVESEQEAIAFAYYFTGSEPIYNLDFLIPEEEYQYYMFYNIDSITGNIDSVETKIPHTAWWDVYLPEIESSYVKN